MEKISYKGKDYFFSDMTYEHLDDFTEWGRQQLPHPVDQVTPKLSGLTPEQQKMILEAAVSVASRVISQADERIHALMLTPEGRVKMLSLMLRDRHPAMTAKECLDTVKGMASELGTSHLLNVLKKLTPKDVPAEGEPAKK